MVSHDIQTVLRTGRVEEMQADHITLWLKGGKTMDYCFRQKLSQAAMNCLRNSSASTSSPAAAVERVSTSAFT